MFQLKRQTLQCNCVKYGKYPIVNVKRVRDCVPIAYTLIGCVSELEANARSGEVTLYECNEHIVVLYS